ncbi:hypothetical protein CKA56_05905 [Arcobacter venerupis]|nr:hypothetical protein [Arcobacter venerupis]RWS50012.1 hypothetical protein CKA56_05905 [Arcobacter venerupis]
MKTVFFLLFFFSFSNSEYLMTLEQNNNNGTLISCIKDYSYSQNQINYIDLENVSHSLNTFDYQTINLEQGYTYSNGVCYMDRVNLLGLTYDEFNYLMAVYGIFLSSLISYGLIKAF